MSEPTAPAKTPRWATGSPDFFAEPSESGANDCKDTGFCSGDASDTRTAPPVDYMNWLLNTIYTWIVWFIGRDAISLGGSDQGSLTISSNNVTPTVSQNKFAGAGTVHNILSTNFNPGRVIVLMGDGSNAVTISHEAGSAGQVHLAGAVDVVVKAKTDYLVLELIGADWYEVSRSLTLGFIKAFGSFDGTGATGDKTVNNVFGAPTANHDSTGVCTVTLATAMKDLNYGIKVTVGKGAGVGSPEIVGVIPLTTTTFRINTVDGTSTLVDCDYIYFEITQN